MIGELNEQQMEDLLQKEVIGRIACHYDNFIYLIPTSYAYDGRSIYAHSLEGTKLAVMRKNPEVCFEVDDVMDMANWRSVIAWGNFEELKDENRSQALKLLLQRQLPLNFSSTTHLGNAWPFTKSDLDDIDGVVYRITLVKKTGRFEHTPAPTPHIV